MGEGGELPPQQSGADRGRNIVRGLGSLTIQSVLNAVLSFVLLTFLVRYLTLDDYGAYSSVAVSMGIAAAVAGFGLSAAAVRFLAPSSRSDDGSGWGSAKAALYLTALFAGVASLVVVGLAPYLSDYFAKGPSEAWIFYLGALWLFSSTVAGPVQAFLQGLRRYGLLAKVLVASRFVSVTAVVAGVAVYHSLTIALLSATIFSALVVLGALPIVTGPVRRADPRPHYSTVLRYSIPLGLAGIVGTVAANADVVVVGGYLPQSSLAIYYATIQVSSILGAFFVAPLITPLFAEASFSSSREEELKLGTGLALRFSMMTLLPASFFTAAMAPQLIVLFSGGGGYSLGVPFLELIALFYVFSAVETIAFAVLQGVSRTREVLVVGAVTALGEVALSASLVPGLGLAGAAYSRVAMFVVGCGLSLYYIRRYLPRPFDPGFYVRAAAASAVPAVAVYLPSTMVSDRVITLVPYTVLGVAVFVACAKLLKLLSDDDKAFMQHLLPAGLRWVLRLL